jgi:hypothetical protein
LSMRTYRSRLSIPASLAQQLSRSGGTLREYFLDVKRYSALPFP